MLLGGLFKRLGRDSWGNGPEREEGIAEIERRASAYGLPPLCLARSLAGEHAVCDARQRPSPSRPGVRSPSPLRPSARPSQPGAT